MLLALTEERVRCTVDAVKPMTVGIQLLERLLSFEAALQGMGWQRGTFPEFLNAAQGAPWALGGTLGLNFALKRANRVHWTAPG